MMKRFLFLPLLIALCIPFSACTPQRQIIQEEIVDTVNVKDEVTVYERQAGELAEIFATADAACRSRKIDNKECQWLDTLYHEARKAFIASGEAKKAYIESPGPDTKLKAGNADKKYGFLRQQAIDEIIKNGLEVGNDGH